MSDLWLMFCIWVISDYLNVLEWFWFGWLDLRFVLGLLRLVCYAFGGGWFRLLAFLVGVIVGLVVFGWVFYGLVLSGWVFDCCGVFVVSVA